MGKFDGTDVMTRPTAAMRAAAGMTQRGMPLALNRAPPPDLAPWIARIVVAQVSSDPGFSAECGVCSDIAYQRFLIAGKWHIETPGRSHRLCNGPLLVGPQTRMMPVRCEGPAAALGIGFRPGALRALAGIEMPDLIDRVEARDLFGLLDEGPFPTIGDGTTPGQLADELERRFRRFLGRAKPPRPSPVSGAFEYQSFLDPGIGPGEFANANNMSLRTLERLVKRDFGTTPRTVLRRARALDLAAHMLGIGHDDEEGEALLRFFDQSHCIREFQTFFGMTPQALRAKQRIMFTISLETRSARRLEELRRIGPDEPRPWQIYDRDRRATIRRSSRTAS